jgi:hypothetical protein
MIARTHYICAPCLAFALICLACNPDRSDQISGIKSPAEKQAVWTEDEMAVKQKVDQFLKTVGNYDFEALKALCVDDVILGAAGLRNGEWNTRSMTLIDYIGSARDRELIPFFEPAQDYIIHINQGQLAWVRADAILHRMGIPLSRNIDDFTLIRDDNEWKFLNLAYTATPLDKEDQVFDLDIFARSYAQAWSGKRPEFVAMYFAEDGSLRVNDADPAVGRQAIADVALSFMTDLPDMLVRYDSLIHTSTGPQFHWTLIATNTGPGGTGNKVQVSGYEEWTLNEDQRILKSQGHFPSEEYDRQLQDVR